MKYKWKLSYWALMISSCLVHPISVNATYSGALGGLSGERSPVTVGGVNSVDIEWSEDTLREVPSFVPAEINIPVSMELDGYPIRDETEAVPYPGMYGITGGSGISTLRGEEGVTISSCNFGNSQRNSDGNKYTCVIEETDEVVEVDKSGDRTVIKPHGKLSSFGESYRVNNAHILIEKGRELRDSILVSGQQAEITADAGNDAPGLSSDNVVKSGGEIHVRGGVSKKTMIEDGGIELVEAGNGKRGTSENATVKLGGLQKIDNGGQSTGTVIHGGKQIVTGKAGKDDTIKDDTQDSFAGASRAYDTKIYGDGDTEEKRGEQKVYDGAVAYNTKIFEGGSQHITKSSAEEKVGGTAVDTEVFSGGRQYVSAGGSAIKVVLHGDAAQGVYTGGYVKDLTVNDRARSWVNFGAVLDGRVEIKDQGAIHLEAGEGKNRTKVDDLILSGKDTLLFAVGAGKNGNSTLIKKLSGNGTVRFTFKEDGPYFSQLHIDELLGSLDFEFNTSIAEGNGDYLFIEKGAGDHRVVVYDSGVEITDPLSKKHDLITDKSKGANFTLTKLSGEKINAVDGGVYMYSLYDREDDNGKIWYLATKDDKEPEPDKPKPSPSPTTPSTDAILSMAVVPGLVFHNELNNLRAGKALLNRDNKNNALWSYLIKGKERIARDHMHFDLDQTGMILGADHLEELMSGEFYIGGFGSYDQAHVTHVRKGTSNVDVYSAGIYASYFDNKGWYADSILKYNYYRNHLNAISTNGDSVRGDYKRRALGGSLELGYRFHTEFNTWVQPYGQLTWLKIEGKDVEISNGMMAEIDSTTSLRSAVGLSVGHDFSVGMNTQLMSYVTASWLREYVDDNYVVINKKHRFVTDLSGNMGKFGIGLKGMANEHVTFYGEVDYLKGSKKQQSLYGTLGLRYSF
ncbi:autotransporter outer membrane beta-barrel domain-containing protein [Bartonella ancashensis]|uniref:Putative autotransporter n=2 Tax=Bartonella ancashensis TaxID=1318743 RepID=A0A0M3T345_9HYPH|nr:Putative autotransporter [Bartonella ancashensis]